MSSELRSLEVSYFVQATEDEEKIGRGVRGIVGTQARGEREEAEGHFGNKIVWQRFHLVGEEASAAFARLLLKMDRASENALLGEIGTAIDEHGALFIRLSKQLITRGVAEVTTSDPIRVKVKPRRPPKSDPIGFYRRLIEEARA